MSFGSTWGVDPNNIPSENLEIQKQEHYHDIVMGLLMHCDYRIETLNYDEDNCGYTISVRKMNDTSDYTSSELYNVKRKTHLKYM